MDDILVGEAHLGLNISRTLVTLIVALIEIIGIIRLGYVCINVREIKSLKKECS